MARRMLSVGGEGWLCVDEDGEVRLAVGAKSFPLHVRVWAAKKGFSAGGSGRPHTECAVKPQ
jgi:hypothetical protein